MREESQLPDHPETNSVPSRGLKVETANQHVEQGTTTPPRNITSANVTNLATAIPELCGETAGIATLNPSQESDTELNTPNIPEKDFDDGLRVETPNPSDNHNIEQLENSTVFDTQKRLHVETRDCDKKDSVNKVESESENGLQVETQDKTVPKHGMTTRIRNKQVKLSTVV